MIQVNQARLDFPRDHYPLPTLVGLHQAYFECDNGNRSNYLESPVLGRKHSLDYVISGLCWKHVASGWDTRSARPEEKRGLFFLSWTV